MNIDDAVIKRILEICEAKKSSICEISLKAGMSPSNIYALIKKRTKNLKVNTVQRFCEGAGITLAEFFTNKLFENIEPEF
ncbi:MAG: helix-turn-helix transcriptional regulator [Firmicutes bacterium]|nr:helix-turn-helix transcriptional regulator [Bacillota bacterium]